jgi:hypothetical protein
MVRAPGVTRRADQALGMSAPLPAACRELIDLQCGVITRWQAVTGGMHPDAIDRLVRGGRWQCLQRSVYAVFTGQPSRLAVLWATLHRAGPDAVLSHQTAAELTKITDQPSSLIHLSIPVSRRIAGIPGAVIHRSARAQAARHPAALPPRTRVEDTVLDLACQAASFDAAFTWACAACQRRLTTAPLLAASMSTRKKMRWRAELTGALAEIGNGAHSLLELRYVRDVERPHGLPRAVRQARITRGGKNRYLDNFYQQYRVCAELDGRAAHPGDQRWRDIGRDNAAAAEGLITVRYNWADITGRPCQTAFQLGQVLRHAGWPGTPRPCGPRCYLTAVPPSWFVP